MDLQDELIEYMIIIQGLFTYIAMIILASWMAFTPVLIVATALVMFIPFMTINRIFWGLACHWAGV